MTVETIHIQNRILTLLDLVDKPMTINRIALCLGDSYYLINISLSRLLSEGYIEIHSKDGENIIAKKSGAWTYRPRSKKKMKVSC